MSAETLPLPELPPLPLPPAGLDAVTPALDLAEWVAEHVLDADGAIYNPDHAHLAAYGASVGWLWMPGTLHKSGTRVLGRCSLGRPSGDKWRQAERADWLRPPV